MSRLFAGVSLVAVLVALLACKGQPDVYAECRGAPAFGFTCTVAHRGGSVPQKVCWDITAKCVDGRSVIAGGCAAPTDHGTVTTMVPAESFVGGDSCALAGVKVDNVRSQ